MKAAASMTGTRVSSGGLSKSSLGSSGDTGPDLAAVALARFCLSGRFLLIEFPERPPHVSSDPLHVL